MLDEAEKGLSEELRFVVAPFTMVIDTTAGRQLILPAGSVWNSTQGKRMQIAGKQLEIVDADALSKPGPEVNLEAIGQGLISIPYLRGGRCGFGFDGPGFVQFLCRLLGKDLPRTPTLQSELGAPVHLMHEAEPGDVAFFDNLEGEITHCGIVLSEGKILHVGNQVRFDRLDQQGIYHAELGKYTHQLRIIKRIP